jgi:O-6-methylguanine DNA methyltransferase
MKKIYVAGFPWERTYLWLAATDDGLAAIDFERVQSFESFKVSFQQDVIERANAHLDVLSAQLDNYFKGQPESFDIPLDFLGGTDFQKSVWAIVHKIPYGQTTTYGQISQKLGKPGAVRAVGAANGANPIPIVVPCHRVIQADGKLGGYSGGLDIKDALLRLEGAVL